MFKFEYIKWTKNSWKSWTEFMESSSEDEDKEDEAHVGV